MLTLSNSVHPGWLLGMSSNAVRYRRCHGDAFPLPENIAGADESLFELDGYVPSREDLRDPRVRECLGSLNVLAYGGQRSSRSTTAHTSPFTAGQKSMVGRTLRRLRFYKVDPLAGEPDRACLQQLLKNRDFYGLEQFHARRPYQRDKVNVLHKQLRPLELAQRLTGEAAKLHEQMETSIERTNDEMEFLCSSGRRPDIRP